MIIFHQKRGSGTPYAKRTEPLTETRDPARGSPCWIFISTGLTLIWTHIWHLHIHKRLTRRRRQPFNIFGSHFKTEFFCDLLWREAGGFCFFHYSFHGNRMEQLLLLGLQNFNISFLFGDFSSMIAMRSSTVRAAIRGTSFRDQKICL